MPRNRSRHKRTSPNATSFLGVAPALTPAANGGPAAGGAAAHATPPAFPNLNSVAFAPAEDANGEEQEEERRMFSIRGVAMFRAGDYGPKGKFTESDLQEMADTYDPDWLHAAVTPDHVQEGVALGWIDRVYRDGDVLRGDWSVHPETYYAMKEGYYTRRSIEIYRGVPFKDGKKVQYVKACSILGAAVPEVKGLERIKFSDSGDFAQFEHFDFSENSNAPEPVAAGESKATKEPEMDGVQNNTPAAGTTATPPAPGNAPAAFAGMTEAEFNAKIEAAASAAADRVRTEYETRLKEADERAGRFATGLSEVNQKLREKDEATRFNEAANTAAAAGRLPKAERDFLAAIFCALPHDDAEGATVPFTFTEGAEPEQIAARALLLKYMETKTAVAPVGQQLQSSPTAAFGSQNPTPSGAAAMEPVKRAEWIDKRATELSEEHPDKSFGDCMLMAERELMARPASV